MSSAALADLAGELPWEARYPSCPLPVHTFIGGGAGEEAGAWEASSASVGAEIMIRSANALTAGITGWLGSCTTGLCRRQAAEDFEPQCAFRQSLMNCLRAVPLRALAFAS